MSQKLINFLLLWQNILPLLDVASRATVTTVLFYLCKCISFQSERNVKDIFVMLVANKVFAVIYL